jgi:LysM domain
MANLIEHLTSISPRLRSGPSPGRRVLALALCAMLALSSTLPAVAFAGESDSEGTGTAPPTEAPGAPDFDPGGEEAALEEAPASGGAPEPEPVQQAAAEPAQSEPAANQSLTAPRQKPAKRHASHDQTAPTEAVPPTEPAEEETPSPPPPQPVATPVDPGRSLAGKDFYTVRPGDCLWHIAADMLSGKAGTQEIEREVERLWRLNEDRIGTGDPSLIYAGTVLRLH